MEEQKEKMPQQYYQDDEITLKELILKIQEYWQEILMNWKLVILVSGLFASGFLLKAWLTPATYPATLTFMVDEDEGGGDRSGAGAILGQFGFGGGGGKFNLDKIVELSRSRKIVSMALFEKETIAGKEDFLVNHIIREYDFHEKWEDDNTGLKEFYFRHDDFEKFSRNENNVLKSVFGKVVGNPMKDVEGLMSSGYNKDTGILHVSSKSTSEMLSIKLANQLYKNLSEFYIEKTIAKQQLTYEILKTKLDSLNRNLTNTNYALLKFEDTFRNLGLKQYQAKKIKLQGELQKYAAAYAATYQNLEIADFSLKNKTPFIVAIDEPISPISPSIESKIKALIIGGFLGGFITITFLIGRKLVFDQLN